MLNVVSSMELGFTMSGHQTRPLNVREENMMTLQRLEQNFIPRQYEVFAGLDVDKNSIAVTFSDHTALLRSLRMPYSAEHLLNYTRKHFAGRKIAFAYEAGPTGFGLYDCLTAQGHPCLVVAPSMVPTAPADNG